MVTFEKIFILFIVPSLAGYSICAQNGIPFILAPVVGLFILIASFGFVFFLMIKGVIR